MHLYVTVLNRYVREDTVDRLEARKRRPGWVEERERNQIGRAVVTFTVIDYLKHKGCPNGFSIRTWIRIGIGYEAAHRR